MPEKMDLVAQNKKIEILMLVSRYNPLLCCVKTLNDKTLYAQRDGWPKLPYSGQAIVIKHKKTLIEVPLSVNVEEMSLFGVTLALVAPWH